MSPSALPLLALLALDEVEDVLGVAPVLADANLEVEVDLVADVLRDLLAGLDADLLNERAVAADDDLAVVVLLDEDRRANKRSRVSVSPSFFPVRLLLLFDGLDVDGGDERQFLGDLAQDLFADDLGEEEAFRLVGDLLVGVDLLGLSGRAAVSSPSRTSRLTPLRAEMGMISRKGRRSL